MNGRLLSGQGGKGHSRRYTKTGECAQETPRSLLWSEYRTWGRVRHATGEMDGVQAVKGLVLLASGSHWRFEVEE